MENNCPIKNVDIIFCLHPNMQAFVEYFDIPDYIKVIRQGEVDVQLLIKESKLMITDYSSVAFDFSFLENQLFTINLIEIDLSVNYHHI